MAGLMANAGEAVALPCGEPDGHRNARAIGMLVTGLVEGHAALIVQKVLACRREHRRRGNDDA